MEVSIDSRGFKYSPASKGLTGRNPYVPQSPVAPIDPIPTPKPYPVEPAPRPEPMAPAPKPAPRTEQDAIPKLYQPVQQSPYTSLPSRNDSRPSYYPTQIQQRPPQGLLRPPSQQPSRPSYAAPNAANMTAGERASAWVSNMRSSSNASAGVDPWLKANVTGQVTPEFTSYVYQNTLNRAPDTAGSQYWQTAGLTPQQVAAGVAASPEARARWPQRQPAWQPVNPAQVTNENLPTVLQDVHRAASAAYQANPTQQNRDLVEGAENALFRIRGGFASGVNDGINVINAANGALR